MKHVSESIIGQYSEQGLMQWQRACRSRLIADIRSGKLNPCKWFPMQRMQDMISRYGLSEEHDLQIDLIPLEIAKEWNYYIESDFIARNPGQRQLKAITCFRLNPNKFYYFLQESKYALKIYRS